MAVKQKTFIKNLFSLAVRLIYERSVRCHAITHGNKSLLIIRIDGIGDYVLFRNMIEFLRSTKEYANAEITLMCSSAASDLALTLDKDQIDKFIVFHRNKFYKDPVYMHRFLSKISSSYYDVVISPAFNRNLFFSDTFAKLVHAPQKFTFSGDFTDITPNQKKLSNSWYTHVIQAKKGILFEYFRNIEFIEKFTGHKYKGPVLPVINFSNKGNFTIPNKAYAVYFLGAGEKIKKWSAENFAKVAKFIYNEYNYVPVICGSAADLQEAALFKQSYKAELIDLCGKTSMTDMLVLLKSSSCILSNETGAVHMACAVGAQNIFVLSNGITYGRFLPYPESLKSYHCILCPEAAEMSEELLSSEYSKRVFFNINSITVDQVIKKIKSVL